MPVCSRDFQYGSEKDIPAQEKGQPASSFTSSLHRENQTCQLHLGKLSTARVGIRLKSLSVQPLDDDF